MTQTQVLNRVMAKRIFSICCAVFDMIFTNTCQVLVSEKIENMPDVVKDWGESRGQFSNVKT